MDFDAEISRNGFSLLRDVLDAERIDELLKFVDEAIHSNDLQTSATRSSNANIKSSRGETYAACNLAAQSEELRNAWKSLLLVNVLTRVLGKDFGLVRVLFFDKHPNRTWSLPWHKDMTIAVKDNSLPSRNSRSQRENQASITLRRQHGC